MKDKRSSSKLCDKAHGDFKDHDLKDVTCKNFGKPLKSQDMF